MPITTETLHDLITCGNTSAVLKAVTARPELLDSPCHYAEDLGRMEYPLHLAASFGHYTMVERFLKIRPADIDRVTKKGQTAVHMIARDTFSAIPMEHHVSLLRLFLSRGSKALTIADKKGRLPLHLAVLQADKRTIVYIANHNKSALTAKDACGRTPFHSAVIAARRDVAQLFLAIADNRRIVNTHDEEDQSPLTSACRVNLKMVKLVLSAPRDRDEINYADLKGVTPLIAALKAGKIDIAIFLLENGATVPRPVELTVKCRLTLRQARRLLKRRE